MRRQAFIIGLTKQLAADYAPSYAIFAKGDQSEKLIIVGMDDGQFNTIYRARALLASHHLGARHAFFQQNTIAERRRSSIS